MPHKTPAREQKAGGLCQDHATQFQTSDEDGKSPRHGKGPRKNDLIKLFSRRPQWEMRESQSVAIVPDGQVSHRTSASAQRL